MNPDEKKDKKDKKSITSSSSSSSSSSSFGNPSTNPVHGGFPMAPSTMGGWNPQMAMMSGMNPSLTPQQMPTLGWDPATMQQATADTAMMEWYRNLWAQQQSMYWAQHQLQHQSKAEDEGPLTPPPPDSDNPFLSPGEHSYSQIEQVEEILSASREERAQSSSSSSSSTPTSRDDRSCSTSSSHSRENRDNRSRSSSSFSSSSSSSSSSFHSSSSREQDYNRDKDRSRTHDQSERDRSRGDYRDHERVRQDSYPDRDRSSRDRHRDRGREQDLDRDRDERKRKNDSDLREAKRTFTPASTTSSASSSSSSSPFPPGGSGRRREKGNDEEVTGLAVRKERRNNNLGTMIKVFTNHYPLQILSKMIYQYDVVFEPVIESRGTQRFLLNQHKETLGKIVFDGKQMFLQTNLGPEIHLKSLADRTGVTYSITIKKTKELSRHECPSQVYNICIRQLLRLLKLKLIGRQHFDPDPRGVISLREHRVELWPGYFASTSPDTRGITFLCDLTHKVIRTDTVMDTYQDLKRKFGRGNEFRTKFTKTIVGQIVLTRYNNRSYRVDDIEWNKTPDDEFPNRKSGKMSFFHLSKLNTYREYIAAVYNKNFSDRDQPLLVHRSTSRAGEVIDVHLIPELCSMTGLSDDMKKDRNVMKAVADKTRQPPEERVRKTREFIQKLTSSRETATELASWNIEFSRDMLEVDALQLRREVVYYHDNAEVGLNEKGDWSFAVKNNQLVEAIALRSWLLLYPEQLSQMANDVVRNLERVGRGIGQQVHPPTHIPLRRDEVEGYLKGIEDNLTEGTQIVVCILVNDNKDRYSTVKKFCSFDSRISVPSQCLVQRTLGNPKNLMSVCTKVLQQIYAKIGSSLWRLSIPFKNSTMIVGIDVCHDGERRGRSIAGFCASYDRNFTKYFSMITKQNQGQELVDGLRQCMTKSLRFFFEQNRNLPEKIIIYRDGLGDGQLEAAKTHELPQILEAISGIMHTGLNGETTYTPMPEIVFVVVRKRIHTRFFEQDRSCRNRNPLPGTVIDSDVIQKDRYEFFLVSQFVNQGTVTPTNYLVLYDSSRLAAEHLQALSYKLCHLYFNWPGTIRVPAPVAYAHKLAFLVGQSIHEDPNPKLRDRLHFL